MNLNSICKSQSLEKDYTYDNHKFSVKYNIITVTGGGSSSSKESKYIDIKTDFINVSNINKDQFLILDAICKKSRDFFDTGSSEFEIDKLDRQFKSVTASSLNLD